MYKEIIDWIDFILVPAYLFMFLLILQWIKKRNPNNILIQKYLVKGFLFKVACAIFYGLLLHFYYGYGDSLSYFKDAIYIKQLIGQGSETIRVLFKDYIYAGNVYGPSPGTQGNWALERLTLVLSYISFSRYLVVTLFFCMIAYSGMFKMFITFADILPKWHKKLALIVLFFPSISVYGGGILKDTLCMAALGWLVYCVHQLFVKRHFKIKYIIVLLLSIIVISTIKVYIIAAIIPPYIFYLIIILVRRIKNVFIRRAFLPFLILFIVGIFMFFSDTINEQLGSYSADEVFKTIKAQQQEYLRAEDAELGSVFDLGNFEPTLTGFLKKMPEGIVAAIYRPFIWESKKVIMIFSALESLIFLWFTLYVMYKAGVGRFFKEMIQNPFIFFCITFSLMFGALVGLSTFNFGTLVRYRIPLIPFYMTGLLAILYQVTVVKPGILPEKTV